MPDRDYNAAVAALNTLQSNFSIVEAIRKNRQDLNQKAIPEMIEWCRRSGYEPSDFDTLNPIHIAGTKGKGSTSSFVSSILAQYLRRPEGNLVQGIPSSVGLYTSPHLRNVRERIQIDNEPISEELFAKYFWQTWDRFEAAAVKEGHSEPHSTQTKPLYFRYLTLMGLHCYKEEQVGSVVVECGIGGEYDSTNILVKPSVSAVTSLGIDHTAILGDTLESIAWHKGGVFKENVPAFTTPQSESALAVLKQRAEERGTTLQVVGQHSALKHIKLGLQGDFQRINASLAISVAAAHLRKLGFSGVPDPSDANSPLPKEFVTGLEQVTLGGRCEVRHDAKQAGLTWYIDGGHTLESIELAGQWFATTTGTRTVQEERTALRILIFNQQTRDAGGLARKLHHTLADATDDRHPFQHAIFCTNTTYESSGYKADLVSMNTNKDDVDSLRVQKALAATWDDVDSNATVHVLGTIEEAIGRARQLAEGRSAEVLVTGSLHLVGGVIEVLESEKEAACG